MGHQIEYSNHPNAERQALIDTLNYVGRHNYKVMARGLKQNGPSIKRQIEILFAFRLGVEGYPVRVFIQRYMSNWDACDA